MHRMRGVPLARKPRWQPPQDRKEKHFVGYNFAGPGTNVTRRLKDGVKPVNAIDKACLEHDLVTEPRGPHTGAGKPWAMRAADRRLIVACKKNRKLDPPVAQAIIIAMKALLRTGARGRR